MDVMRDCWEAAMVFETVSVVCAIKCTKHAKVGPNSGCEFGALPGIQARPE